MELPTADVILAVLVNPLEQSASDYLDASNARGHRRRARRPLRVVIADNDEG